MRSNKAYAALSDAEALRHVGEIKYRDLNGDGQITQDDRTIIGNTNPDFTYSMTHNISYKDFSLSFMLQGSQGNDIFNYNLTDVTMSNIGNIPVDAYDHRWTQERVLNGSPIEWPKATAGYTRTWLVSDRYVENGSYLKMKYITLGYDWRKPLNGIESIHFSLTANNLFTITDYSWFDPDVNAGGSNAACPGVDSYSYPSARSFAFGIKLMKKAKRKIQRVVISLLTIATSLPLGGLGWALTSCSSWIEEDPEGLVTDERVGDSEEAAANWVTGTYSKLIYDMFCWGYFPRVLEFDADYISGPDWLFGTFGAGNFQGESDVTDALWQGCYGLIGKAALLDITRHAL